MKRIIRGFVPVLAALSLAVTGLAGPAEAAGDTTLTLLKTEITRRIDLRVRALNQFELTIGSARRLTAEHRSSLHDLIGADITGLNALKAKVAGETTREALRADAQSMINDYRVFMLVGPKVRLTIVGDVEATVIDRLRKAYEKLAGLVSRAKSAGHDTSAAEQDLAEMLAAIEKASGDIDGKVEALLAVQAGPDAASIRAQVSACRTALKAGRADLKTAVAEARSVRAFLRGLRSSPAPADSTS